MLPTVRDGEGRVAAGRRAPANRVLPLWLTPGSHLAAVEERLAAVEERHDLERRRRQVFETALERLPLGIAILDSQGMHTRWANRAFREYLDEPWSEANLTGLKLQELMPHMAESGLEAIMHKVVTSGRPCSDLHYVVNGPRHKARFWRISLQPLPDCDSAFGDLLVQIEDVSDQLRPQRCSEAAPGQVNVRR